MIEEVKEILKIYVPCYRRKLQRQNDWNRKRTRSGNSFQEGARPHTSKGFDIEAEINDLVNRQGYETMEISVAVEPGYVRRNLSWDTASPYLTE